MFKLYSPNVNIITHLLKYIWYFSKFCGWLSIWTSSELDDRMDVTEDPVAQDPETASIVLTDEQLAEELYSPQTGP